MQAMLRTLALVLAVVGLVVTPVASGAVSAPRGAVEPLRQAHAHNDYAHDRPLFDALDHGFTSVEADIFLKDGRLLVGHTEAELDPERTLQSLYLEPLRERVLANGGSVYPGDTGVFQLLVDIKNTGVDTYTELDRVQRDPRYQFLFTHYARGSVQRGPVGVTVSGDRPRELMEGQQDRFAFYDGRMTDSDDLGIGADAKLVPLVSDNWTNVFTWAGIGPMPADEREKLHKMVDDAHAAGQRFRFWATPDVAGPWRDAVWTELLDANVDHINTDDLEGLEKFLRERG